MFAKRLSIVVVALAATMLAGCAATRQVNRDTPVSDKALSEAAILVDTTRQTNALVYRLSTSSASQCTATNKPHRARFSLLFNAANTPSEELRTAVFRVAGIAELPVLQVHTAELGMYEGAHVSTINGKSTLNMNKAYASLRDALEDARSIDLTFDDGRSISTTPVAACDALVFPDFSNKLKEPFNNFVGAEVTPRSWLSLARNENERAFILGRSIYFASGDGRSKLYHAFLAGSAATGVLEGLTFGLGPFIANPRTIAVRMRRGANRTEADIFAVRMMQRAGFDPKAALAFAQRSIEEGRAWPSDADELKFDAARLAALKQSMP